MDCTVRYLLRVSQYVEDETDDPIEPCTIGQWVVKASRHRVQVTDAPNPQAAIEAVKRRLAQRWRGHGRLTAERDTVAVFNGLESYVANSFRVE